MKLLIFPCNGNGLEALDSLPSGVECAGFVDDLPEKQGTQVAGIPVFSREAFVRFADAAVLAVPGSPASFHLRDTQIQSLGLPAERYATIIHPRACVSPLASVGRNVLLMAGVVVSARARIGDHVCILPNSVIHHDSSIGEYTLVGSQVVIAGHTHIGEKCYIGSSASVINGIRIGSGTLVGMGSNVIREIGSGEIYAGNPARPLPGKA
ncbi:MAG: NeuD/PglB/VioB family sugar acetyltransferase [Flavobacteriales bacterium]|jgi:sugar O-acyltransferase (sialic acid O-acetyltransferase NeuD family)